ncbi:MAG: DUF948 domain-containing protein [Actinomycetaceae bacterium]|nr:DUF948 domain-containing protein [Actinomycetaceae bacterium]
MNITLGQIAGLLAALGFLVLVYFSIQPLKKLSQVLDRLSESLRELTEHTLPAIDEAAHTVAQANNQVKRLDAITAAAERTSEDISAMTTLVTSTVGAPFLAARRGAQKIREKVTGESASSEPVTTQTTPPNGNNRGTNTTPTENTGTV